METMTAYCAKVFQVLGQASRFELVEALRDGELTVLDIAARIGKQQSNTSRHIAHLYAAGLLVNRKVKRSTYYRLKHAAQTLELVDIAKGLDLRYISQGAVNTEAGIAEDGERITYVDVLKIMGEPKRMQLIEEMLSGEKSVTALMSKVGGEQSLISHHLILMLTHGMVRNRLDAGRSFYMLDERARGADLIDAARNIMAQETLSRQMILTKETAA